MKVSTISPFVYEWFSHTDSAKILHVFRQSCNFINTDEELISLVTSDVGPGPFSAVLIHDDPMEGRGDFSSGGVMCSEDGRQSLLFTAVFTDPV